MSVLHEHTELSDRARRADASDRIKARARQLGFHKVGIARAETLSPEGAQLKAWLGRGYQGEMAWMARDPEQRTDPRKLFPAARSVVVVALNYYTPHQHEVSTTCVSGWVSGGDQPITGKVSRYA